MIIYKATNEKNRKSYIGQTTHELQERIKSHFIESKKDNLPFHNALQKYNKYFSWEIIEHCQTKRELDEMEFHYIMQYNTFFPDGYNLTYGGEGTHGWVPTKEQKQKISYGVKSWWANQSKQFKKEWGKKKRESNLGRQGWSKGLTKETDERVMKISKANKGTPLSSERRHKIGISCKGNKHTEETKNKIRISKLGRKNAWHISNISKQQLENKSKYLYEIETKEGKIITTKVLSAWCRENNINYEKFRSYVNINKFCFGYKVRRL